MTTPTLWVLGAPDPEMEAIENLLREAGVTYGYATAADRRRVHPGNAYNAASIVSPDGETIDMLDASVITVECAITGVKPTMVIDHHRPGDPGYGRPPAEFLPASSIGQVVSILTARGLITWPAHRRCDYACCTGDIRYGTPGGWEVVVSGHDAPEGDYYWAATVLRDIVLTAAADHCLAAAYRGECPGVDPAELMQWRVQTRAAFQGRPVADVLADVERAIAALRAAPTVEIAGVPVADLGDRKVPEVPEASARAGIPFLATGIERDGRRKQVLQSAPPEVIAAWMAEHPGSYGDPARGFAGRYT